MPTIFVRHSCLHIAVLAAAVLFVAGSGPARAQSGMRSIEAVSTGGGTSALGTGPAQLYSNPAHLTVGDRDHAFELQLFRIGAYVGGDLFQFNHFNPLFINNEEALSNTREKAILEDWFGNEQRQANMYVELLPVSMTYRPPDRRWAVGGGIRGRITQTTALTKGLLDLVYRGTGTDRTLQLDGRTRLYSTIDLTGAFSYRFRELPLSVGVSPRILFGLGYADGTLNSQARIRADSVTHQFEYTARAAGPISTGLYDTFNAFSSTPVDRVMGGSAGIAGVGGGLDVGATYSPRSDLHVSMSITDLGLVRWTEDAQTVTPSNDTFVYDGITLNLQRLEDEFDGDTGAYIEHQLDSLARAAYQDVERTRAPFTTGLPTTLHLSSTWEQAPFTVNGGISFGFNEQAGAVPQPAAVHAGGEVVLGPVPLRAGLRVWGSQALTLSGGIGLHVGGYRFDLGGSVTPKTSFLGGGARYAISVSLATIRF